MKLHRFSTALLAAVTVAAVAACSDDDDDNPTGTATANTTVRFVNAIPGATLDFAQNGTVGTGNGNVAYGSSSSCMRVNNANPQLSVRSAGSTTSLPGFSATFAANGVFTVLVTGTTAAPVYTTLDDAFTTPTTGNAAVRVINATSSATAGAGNWDIYVNPTATLGTPNATAVGRNKASSYLTVPAAQTNTLRLTNTGSTTTLQNITVPSITTGNVTSVVVTDAATGSTTLQTFALAACPTT